MINHIKNTTVSDLVTNKPNHPSNGKCVENLELFWEVYWTLHHFAEQRERDKPLNVHLDDLICSSTLLCAGQKYSHK